jgi:hypothetical protein
LFEPLADYLDDIEWRPAGRRVSVVRATLGEWAGAYGAAWNAKLTAEAVADPEQIAGSKARL